MKFGIFFEPSVPRPFTREMEQAVISTFSMAGRAVLPKPSLVRAERGDPIVERFDATEWGEACSRSTLSRRRSWSGRVTLPKLRFVQRRARWPSPAPSRYKDWHSELT